MNNLKNTAADRLRSGELSLGVSIRITASTSVCRTMAAAGFDWLFIDLEHGSLSLESAAQISTAALDSGITSLVRVPPGQYWMATRALEGGALGIVMSDVRTAEEAQALADLTKFRPIGRRNVGGPPVHTAFKPRAPADMAKLFNDSTLTVVLVESAEGLANLDQIAAVDGIDVIMMGGNDLSTAMGIPGETGHPDIVSAYERLIVACKKNGKWAGMGGVMNNAHAQRFIQMGVQFVLAGSDSSMLAGAAQLRSAELRSLG